MEASTPEWFRPRARRRGTPTPGQVALAAELLYYAQQRARAGTTDLPEAWGGTVGGRPLIVVSDTVPTALAACSLPPLFPLRLGDVLSYTHVAGVPCVKHDMIYVGNGCVVSMHRVNRMYADGGGAVRLQHHASLAWTSGRKLLFRSDCYGSALSRLDIVTRALHSIGSYTYKSVTFNCEHVVNRILGRGWWSASVMAMLVIFLAVVAIVVASANIVGYASCAMAFRDRKSRARPA